MFEYFFITDIPANAEGGVYNLWLVFLSYIVASAASYTAFTLTTRLVEEKDPKNQKLWQYGGAFAMGAGIWSMHFIGMLAFKMDMWMDYDLWITLLSMLVAIAIAYFVLEIVKGKELTLKNVAYAAVLLGIGICTMHYTGMAAMIMDGDLRYTPDLFFLSVAIAITASAVALWLLFTLSRQKTKHQKKLITLSALIMGAAICGMHYTGMAAAIFVPWAECRYDPDQTYEGLAMIIGAVACIILALAHLLNALIESNDDIQTEKIQGLTFATKINVMSATLILLTSGTLAYVISSENQKTLEEYEVERERVDLELASQQFKSAIETLLQDVKFLSKSPPIQGMIRAQDAENNIDPTDGSTELLWKQRLTTIFKEFLNNKPLYLQARFIGVENRGMELVRVNRVKGKITEAKELQQKGEAKYFTETIKLPPEKVYLSKIELNREFGKIVKPHTAVIRAAIPVRNNKNNKIFGIVIINLDLTDMLNTLGGIISPKASLYVSNGRGDYLVHPEAEQEFAFEFGKLQRIQHAFPELSEAFEEEVHSPEEKHFFYFLHERDIVQFLKVHFDPINPERFIGIGLSLPHEIALAEIIEIQKYTLVLAIMLVALGVIISTLITRYFMLPIKQITKEAEKFGSKKYYNVSLPTKSKDEIGVLARTFEQMIGSIERRDKELVQHRDHLQEMVEEKIADVIEAKEEAEKAQMEAETLSELPKNNPNPIVKLDQEGNVILVNPAGNKIFPDLKEKGIKHPFLEGVLSFFTSGKKKIQRDIYIGETTYLQTIVITRTQNKNEMILYSLDITPIKKAQEEAEHANQMKTEFISNISHELRTPMHAILSFSRKGIEKINDAEKTKLQKYFETIGTSGKRLSRLIDHLLDISKMEAGMMDYQFNIFDLNDLLNNAIEELSPLMEEKDIEIAVDKGNTKTQAEFDDLRLTQIIINLLSNAIKFSPKGKKVHCTFHEQIITIEKKQISGLALSIEDEGIGIPENELESIFNYFEQSSKTKTGAGGTGIGLALCKSIAESHNGIIWAENVPNGGAKFTIVIPYEQSKKFQKDEDIKQYG